MGLIVLIILIIAITIIVINYEPTKKEESKNLLVTKKEEKKEEPSEELFKVDIKGEIVNPGIYSLSSTARVIDVIEKAGGLTQNANTTVINLSKKITDEMVIIIYSNEEVKDFAKTKEVEQQVQQNCIQKDENALINDACITNSTNTSSKVSINNATLEQLQTLPGIGESKAKDIIFYREQNGPFQTLEDITKVTGIGDSVFAKIKDYITL